MEKDNLLNVNYEAEYKRLQEQIQEKEVYMKMLEQRGN